MPILEDKFAVRFVYTLRLAEGKYYVGHSTTEKRLRNHFKGKGSVWTKQYPPIELIERIDLGNVSYNTAEESENELTLKYMRKFGWKNVRGGYFIYSDEEETRKNLRGHKNKQSLIIDFDIES